MFERKSAIVIPSRMSSQRLPGKPLELIGEKSMIQRVYENCERSNAHKVYVATDSEEIFKHVSDFGNSILTPEFENGTLRVCFAAAKIEQDFDFLINVQGDEPFIDPEFLNSFIRDIEYLKPGNILTAASDLSEENLRDSNSVKIISDQNGKIISFTRSHFFGTAKNVFKHVGIYGFCFKDIESISGMSPTEESKKQSLEQISWMENGFSFKFVKSYQNHICVDTPEDLEKARKRFL